MNRKALSPSGLFAVLAVVCVLALAACAPSARSFGAGERSKLDSLDATGVVRAYFETDNPDAAWYLLSASEQRSRSEPNVVGGHELAGPAQGLVIKGGDVASNPSGEVQAYRDVRSFTVDYTTGGLNPFEDNRRFYFVYVVQEPKANGAWRIGAVGTGP